MLPNRFGYVLKATPNTSSYFECLEMKMRDGVLSVDVGSEKKTFNLAEVESFTFSIGHESLLGIIARGA